MGQETAPPPLASGAIAGAATADAAKGPPGSVGAPPVKPKSREELVALITRLLAQKGDAVANEAEKRVAAGKSINLRGEEVGPDVLKEALRRYREAPKAVGAPAAPAAPASGSKPPAAAAPAAAAPATAARAPPSAAVAALRAPNAAVAPKPGSTPAPAAPAAASAAAVPAKAAPTASAQSRPASDTSSGARWTPATTSAASLANQVLQECENCEAFFAKVVVTAAFKVGVLTKPDIHSKPTGEYIQAGETVEVLARTVQRKDGRVYLRLRNNTGWVPVRSRKDMSKLVLEPAPEAPVLEPPEVSGRALQSRAVRLLPALSNEGKPAVPPSPASSSSAKEPARFRTVVVCPLLSSPEFSSGSTTAGARLGAREEFVADGVFLQAAEGRAFLRLQDGRGWVCERSRSDFLKVAVEPCGVTTAGASDDEATIATAVSKAADRKRAASGHKVIVVQRASDGLGKDADDDQAERGLLQTKSLQDNGPVIFRSDTEIWPEALRPPRPLDAASRVKLRRLFSHFGQKVQECQQDISEIMDRVNGYARACPAQRELKDYAEALQKELAKLQAEWAKSVREVVDGLPPAPAVKAEQDARGAIAPVQVRGRRWYCAVLRSREGLEEGEAAARHLGPLRPSAEEAAEDLLRMCQHLGQEEAPAKRRRLSLKSAGDADPAATE